MGIRVDQLKNGKFRFYHSITDTVSESLTRSQALLYLRNTLSPYDFIKEHYCFPANWTNKQYKRYPWDEKANKKYMDFLKKAESDEEIWDRYLEIIKELMQEQLKKAKS